MYLCVCICVYPPFRLGNVRSNYFNCVDLTLYKHSKFKFGHNSLHLLQFVNILIL